MAAAKPDIFSTVKVAEFRKGSLTQIDLQSSLADAAAKLDQAHVSSAPVWDGINSEFVMLLDYQQLMATAIAFIEEAQKSPARVDVDKILKSVTVQVVPYAQGLSRARPFYTISEDASLHEAVSEFKRLGELGHNVHRLVIMAGDAPVGILSQSDIVRFISQQADKHKAHLSRTLLDLGLVSPEKASQLVKVRETEKVWTALQVMQKENVSSVCLVDATDHYKGVLIFASIKVIFLSKSFKSLESSCIDFYKSQLAHEHKDSDVSDVIGTIHAGASLYDTIRRVTKYHLHRVVILESGRPVGIVTLTDIIRLFQ